MSAWSIIGFEKMDLGITVFVKCLFLLMRYWQSFRKELELLTQVAARPDTPDPTTATRGRLSDSSISIDVVVQLRTQPEPVAHGHSCW
jgi:hypothetical protein